MFGAKVRHWWDTFDSVPLLASQDWILCATEIEKKSERKKKIAGEREGGKEEDRDGVIVYAASLMTMKEGRKRMKVCPGNNNSDLGLENMGDQNG